MAMPLAAGMVLLGGCSERGGTSDEHAGHKHGKANEGAEAEHSSHGEHNVDAKGGSGERCVLNIMCRPMNAASANRNWQNHLKWESRPKSDWQLRIRQPLPGSKSPHRWWEALPMESNAMQS